MRLIYLLGVLAFASTLSATPMSKTISKIRGQILAAANEDPLEYATISAFDPADQLVDGTITDETGYFELNLPSGEYRLRVEFIGFVAQDIPLSVKANVKLETIRLEADRVALDVVEVTAEKSEINLQLDKKVFNVGKDLLSRGGTANEVLDNVPSVTVEANGAVALRGNTGVRILINGRPSSLADNNALSSIPASSIERVEVITNPSARYEAAGTAGIINIVLKADRKAGFNGNATITAGYPADSQPTFGFNFRKNKINIFGNIGAKYANYFGRSNGQRISNLDGVAALLEQTGERDRNDKAGYGYMGMDYLIDPQNTITASYAHYGVVNTDEERRTFTYADDIEELNEEWQQVWNYREPESYNQLDLTYTKTFKEEGKRWTVTAQHDFWFNDENEDTQINEITPTPEEVLRLRTRTLESSHDYLLQTDYNTKVGDKGMLEMGLRGETRVIRSDFIAENRVDDEWQVYLGFDNVLDYYERIGSGYLQYGQKLGKISYLLGLRSEYTLVQIDLESESAVTRKDYTRFFPSFNLSYQASDATSMQLSYSRRIRRPSFWQLNPFRGLSDPNEIFIGNPDMDPAYTDKFEINFLQRWEKLNINPAIYYSATQDYFEFIINQEADGLVVTRPINLDVETNYGFEITGNYRPTEAINIYGEFNFFGYSQKGIFEDRDFAFSSNTWSSRLRLQYKLTETLSFQGSFNFRASYRDAQVRDKAIHFADFAIAKKFLDDRMVLTFNLRNAFDSRWSRSQITRPSFTQTQESAWNVRRYGVSLNYRFQQGDRLPERRSRGSIR